VAAGAEDPSYRVLGDDDGPCRDEVLRDGLRGMGHVEGRSIVIEERWAESHE